MEGIMRCLGRHDKDSFEHSKRVAILAYHFGRSIGLSEEKLRTLYSSSLLHDIGKLRIQKSILTKPGKLKDDEFREILKHPLYSESILRDLDFDCEILKSVRGHHENQDGTGYPDKLKNGEINDNSAIIRIIDSYDAMRNKRSYSDELTLSDTLAELWRHRGTYYREDILDEFLTYVTK